MTIAESITPQDALPVLQETLKQKYQTIRNNAIEVIRNGATCDNPILTKQISDTRWALAIDLVVTGPVDNFLNEVSVKLLSTEPDISLVHEGFRHISMGQIEFNPQGRHAAGVDADVAKRYYEALRKVFADAHRPIHLNLVGVIPAIDREQPSVSVIGVFIPADDIEIVNVRSHIAEEISQPDLLHSSDLNSQIIHTTIGRLPHPPKRNVDTIPLLDALGKINSGMPSGLDIFADTIEICSTEQPYFDPETAIFLQPALSLTQGNDQVQVKFVRARYKYNY